MKLELFLVCLVFQIFGALIDELLRTGGWVIEVQRHHNCIQRIEVYGNVVTRMCKSHDISLLLHEFFLLFPELLWPIFFLYYKL